MRKVLTIAGSDSSGGAGIQADLKTICAHGLYGMSVITSVTAQNTMRVNDILNLPGDFVSKQIESVFEDIVPDSIKIGMLANMDIVKAVIRNLKKYNARNIVLDTVMISTSGNSLVDRNTKRIVLEELFPLVDIVTPNIFEAEQLSGVEINTKSDMQSAAKIISGYTRGAVLIKGGHLQECADDLLYVSESEYRWFCAKKINNPNTHGTGCTLSSAIACELAMGRDIFESVNNAKKYLYGAIENGMDLGRGSGPVNHMYAGVIYKAD